MYQAFKALTKGVDIYDPVGDYYSIVKKLGSGGFSEVYEAFDSKAMTRVALKMLPSVVDMFDYSESSSALSEATLKSVMQQEVEILINLDHPNIIRLIDFDLDARDPWLVLELANGGDLYDKIMDYKRFPEYNTMLLMKEILSILVYLESQGIVHRDIKPENLLYKTKRSDSKLMLTDFGLASNIELGTMTTPCGTLDYSAPELLVNKVFYDMKEFTPQKHSFTVDVWSAGIICYLLLSGYLPFYSATDNEDEIERKIIVGEYNFASPIWSYITLDAVHLIQKMLMNDPCERISASEAIEHNWFSKKESDFSYCSYTELSSCDECDSITQQTSMF